MLAARGLRCNSLAAAALVLTLCLAFRTVFGTDGAEAHMLRGGGASSGSSAAGSSATADVTMSAGAHFDDDRTAVRQLLAVGGVMAPEVRMKHMMDRRTGDSSYVLLSVC